MVCRNRAVLPHGTVWVAYKGLKKNINRLFVLFASVNLLKVLQGGRSAEFRAASL